jgi:hypothetical protein
MFEVIIVFLMVLSVGILAAHALNGYQSLACCNPMTAPAMERRRDQVQTLTDASGNAQGSRTAGVVEEAPGR